MNSHLYTVRYSSNYVSWLDRLYFFFFFTNISSEFHPKTTHRWNGSKAIATKNIFEALSSWANWICKGTHNVVEICHKHFIWTSESRVMSVTRNVQSTIYCKSNFVSFLANTKGFRYIWTAVLTVCSAWMGGIKPTIPSFKIRVQQVTALTQDISIKARTGRNDDAIVAIKMEEGEKRFCART